MPEPLQTLRILSIEDDPGAARALERLLHHHYQCRVDTVASATKALDRVNYVSFEWECIGFHAVFVDIWLPDLNGGELTNILRQTEKNMHGVTVIGVSGRSTMKELSIFKDMGIDDLLLKPATFDAIDAVLRKHLVLDEKLYRTRELMPTSLSV